MTLPTITHVAIRYKGKVYSLPKPNRHHHVLRLIGVLSAPETQGFLDSNGNFLTRREALHVAIDAGQVLNRAAIRAGQLFSEDIW